VIFDSYVSLPEGIEFDGSDNLLSQQKMPSIGFESGEKNIEPNFHRKPARWWLERGQGTVEKICDVVGGRAALRYVPSIHV
jgi:hypothetical protein